LNVLPYKTFSFLGTRAYYRLAKLQRAMSRKSLIIFIILIGLPELVSAQELPPHDLKKSPIRSNPEYERVTRLTDESISELQIDSPLLYNAYKFFLNTNTSPHYNSAKGNLKGLKQISSWRDATLKDIRRRGVAAQQVVEQIYQNSDGKALSMLAKIEYLSDIDKRPFVVWVRKSLEEGKYKEIRSIELSLKADFIAKHGNLDDLTFLERIGREVPMDTPRYVSIIERRKRELSALGPANNSGNPSKKAAKSSPTPEPTFATKPATPDKKPVESSVTEPESKPAVSLWVIIIGGIVLLGIVVAVVRKK